MLRRLKALTIRYENAWWDAVGRGYEEEVATGIVSGYRIARQVSGPRTARTALMSWVTWTQQFHESLKNGNIKRLNLGIFFKLSSPTAQRMYRFLDKRFYNNPELSMDLIEFACGHIGLTENDNVAILKRRLAPALAELEEIGFLAKAEPEERYQKVRAGVWRICVQRAECGVRSAELGKQIDDAVLESTDTPHAARRRGGAGARVLPPLGTRFGIGTGVARSRTGGGGFEVARRRASAGAVAAAGAGDTQGMAGLSLVQRRGAEVPARSAEVVAPYRTARDGARGSGTAAVSGSPGAGAAATGRAALRRPLERPG